MATYTDRLGLAKPEESDAVNVEVINNNMRIIDSLMNMVIGLPVNLADAPNGQLLFDESLQTVALKAHGNLIYLSPISKPKGKVAYTEVNTNTNIPPNTELITGLQATFNAEANRRYCVHMIIPLGWQSGGSNVLPLRGRVYWDQAASITTNSTLLYTFNCNVFGAPGIYRTFSKTFEFFPNVTGQVTIGLGVQNITANQNGNFFASLPRRNAKIAVRDYGPQ